MQFYARNARLMVMPSIQNFKATDAGVIGECQTAILTHEAPYQKRIVPRDGCVSSIRKLKQGS